MRKYHEAYEATAGIALYPGSLNMVVERPWRLPAQRLRIDASLTGVNVNLVPCTLLGTEAFIFRTDLGDAETPFPPYTLEIVSPIPLRATFGLVDGDEIEIEY